MSELIFTDESEPNEISDTLVITKQFNNPQAFSIYIEDLAMRTGESLIDTILAYCEINDIDEEIIGKLISPSLKEKIQVEAVDLNLMKRTEIQLEL